MTAAYAKVSEIDLSTRVPQFPGVYGAIVIPAKKGPVNVPQLVASDSSLLSVYTPDESIEVGYDLAYYSALAYLQKSDKLWVVRAANEPLYGMASLKTLAGSTENFTHTVGLADPTAYTFDGVPDVEAVAHVEDMTCVADVSDSLDGKGVILTDDVGTVAFWIDMDDSGTTIPGWASGADRAVEVITLVTDDAAGVVATKMAAAIDGDSKYGAAADGSDVTVTHTPAGARTGGADTGSSGFSFTPVTAGVDEVNNADECLLIYGANPGVWNDDVYIKVVAYATSPDVVKEEDSFIIYVFKSSNLNVPEEEWLCSRIEGKKDGYGQNIYVEDVLEGSNFIRAFDNSTIDPSLQPKDQATALGLGGGDDGSAVTDSQMLAALATLENPDDIYFTVLMDGGWATPTYQLAMDTLVSERQDSVAIMSVPFSAEASATYVNDILEYRKVTLNLNSSYSALYSPHVKIYDKFNDRNLFVSPDGYVAAIISATAGNFEIWYPPAGFRRGIINVLDLRRRFKTSEMDVLYDQGINPLRFAPGRGIVVWGQKTMLARPSALDRLNVRLMLISVEPAVKEAMEDFLFELNDTATRSLAKAIIESAMDSVQARRGVTEYLVVCDETNNLDSDIEGHIMNLWLFVKPTPSLEFIPIKVVITRQGLDFSLAQQAL